MKKVFILSVIILLLSFSNVNFSNKVWAMEKENFISKELYKESLESLIYTYVSDEEDRYYGRVMPFDKIEILNIQKVPRKFEYEITTQVITHTGAHNPPHTKDTITILASPMGTKVIKSKHEPF